MAGDANPVKWLSVTGQELDLEFDSGYLGLSCHPQKRKMVPIHQKLGQCRSINSFEKLNQLGEGSRSCIIRNGVVRIPNVFVSSLRDCVSCTR